MVNVNDDAYYDNLIKMINKDEFDYLKNNIKSIIKKYRTIVNKCEDYNTLVYKLKDLYNQYLPNLFEVLGKQLFNGTILDLRTDNIKIPQHAYEFIKRYLFLINYQRNTLSNFEFIFNHQTEPLIWIINQDQVSYYPITNKLFMALRDFMFFIEQCPDYTFFQNNILTFTHRHFIHLDQYKDKVMPNIPGVYEQYCATH